MTCATAAIVLKAKIDLVESMGSELYVYFEIESEGVESKELAELAADSGAAEVPGSGIGQVVARLAPESQVRRGEEAELWVDTSKLHLFDPGSRSAARRLAPVQLSRSRRRRWTKVSSCARRVLELLAQLLDHLVVPGVGAQEQVAEADDPGVGLGLGAAAA